MKKFIFPFAVILLTSFHAVAQNDILSEEEQKKLAFPSTPISDTIWEFGGTISLNFSQSYFSNWASGGQNSVAVTAVTGLFAKYNKNRNSWETNLDLAYGLLSQDGNDPVKTDDRIDLTSKYGYQLENPNWYITALFNYRTQFDEGYKIENGAEVGEKISDFMAPAYSILSLGVDYKPNEIFSAFVSPVTAKMTFVNENRLATAYGLDEGESFRAEIGGFAKITFRKDIVENVNLDTRLDLFSNYADHPENVDVNWETLITMKINKWLSTTLTTQLIYDDDVIIGATEPVIDEDTGEIITPGEAGGPRTQFREVFALGLSVQF